MKPELCSYGQWEHCLRLHNTEIDLIVTLDVGPRIIRFGFTEGPNEFREYPEQYSLHNDGKYHSYGGHRLWVAPETEGWTNHPDNNTVNWTEEKNEVVLTAAIESGTGLQKQLRIMLEGSNNRVRISHAITNCSPKTISLAPWAISVMAPGGKAIIPQEQFIPHTERVLPVRPMVLWSYTKMQDPRWKWGDRYIQLHQDSNAETPQKFGAFVSQGWIAYSNQDRIFIKRFPAEHKVYPDFGCNAEVFTNKKMLETESLGPMIDLQPQQSVLHQEDWFLFRQVPCGTTDSEINETLSPLIKSRTQS